jgi:hypothetical protein
MTRHEFFNALFPNPDEGYVDLRAFGGYTAQTFVKIGDWAGADAFIAEHPVLDHYFGVAVRVERDGVLAGKKPNCTVTHAVWADLDWKLYLPAPLRGAMEQSKSPLELKQDIVASPEWQAARDEAFRRIVCCPEMPHIIVESGGGFHVYWLSHAEALVADAELESLNRRIAVKLGSDPSVMNWDRILRVPDTFNFKPEYRTPQPVVVRLLDVAR